MKKKIIIDIEVDEQNTTSDKLMIQDIISELSCCWNATSFKEVDIAIIHKTNENLWEKDGNANDSL